MELRRLLHAGEIQGYRTRGGHWRLPLAGVEAWIQRRCDETAMDREIVSVRHPLRLAK